MDRRSFLSLSALPMLAKPAWLSNRRFLKEIFGITSDTIVMDGQWTTAYKVIDKYSDSPLLFQNTKFELKYHVGKLTYPKVGKVFVYKNLEDAQIHNNSDNSETRILEVSAKNVVRQKNRLYITDLKIHDISWAEWFWKNDSRSIEDRTTRCSKKVYTCDYLKCIKEIENE